MALPPAGFGGMTVCQGTCLKSEQAGLCSNANTLQKRTMPRIDGVLGKQSGGDCWCTWLPDVWNRERYVG